MVNLVQWIVSASHVQLIKNNAIHVDNLQIALLLIFQLLELACWCNLHTLTAFNHLTYHVHFGAALWAPCALVHQMYTTWLHFQSYLWPLLPGYHLSFTIEMPISTFKVPFPLKHLWKITLCSFPYYYFLFPILLLSVVNSRQEFTKPFPLFSPKSLSKLFFTDMPQNPESLHCFVQCKSCFPQYPLLSNCLLVNSHLLSIF